MVYLYGEGAENCAYDVIVDTNGDGRLEILSVFGKDQVVDLGTLEHPEQFKCFENLAKELLRELPDSARVYFTPDGLKKIHSYVGGNSGRYANCPLEKFGLESRAPALALV